MASWLNVYGGTVAHTLQSAATALSTSASGSYTDLNGVDGVMIAELVSSGATNEAHSIAVSFKSCAQATPIAYTAASATYTLTNTGKGMKVATCAIPREDVARFIKPRWTVTGEHIACVRLFVRNKRST